MFKVPTTVVLLEVIDSRSLRKLVYNCNPVKRTYKLLLGVIIHLHLATKYRQDITVYCPSLVFFSGFGDIPKTDEPVDDKFAKKD